MNKKHFSNKEQIYVFPVVVVLVKNYLSLFLSVCFCFSFPFFFLLTLLVNRWKHPTTFLDDSDSLTEN